MDSTMLPPVALIRQVTPAPELEDITATLHKGFAGLDLARRVKPGQKVALTGGSRGITDMAKVIRHTAGFLRSLGAEPYVAPAMGSHGGASGSGQSRLLARLGITEETVGAPIVSHMETRELGRTSFGMPVLIGEDFIRADWIIVVNRVKPHTSFRGSVESGLLKMLAVGMGKRDGAERSHAHFLRHGFETVVRETSAMVMENSLCFAVLPWSKTAWKKPLSWRSWPPNSSRKGNPAFWPAQEISWARSLLSRPIF
jgi:uncharacterized protein (DUF362 family)